MRNHKSTGIIWECISLVTIVLVRVLPRFNHLFYNTTKKFLYAIWRTDKVIAFLMRF